MRDEEEEAVGYLSGRCCLNPSQQLQLNSDLQNWAGRQRPVQSHTHTALQESKRRSAESIEQLAVARDPRSTTDECGERGGRERERKRACLRLDLARGGGGVHEARGEEKEQPRSERWDAGCSCVRACWL